MVPIQSIQITVWHGSFMDQLFKHKTIKCVLWHHKHHPFLPLLVWFFITSSFDKLLQIKQISQVSHYSQNETESSNYFISLLKTIDQSYKRLRNFITTWTNQAGHILMPRSIAKIKSFCSKGQGCRLVTMSLNLMDLEVIKQKKRQMWYRCLDLSRKV